MAVFSREVILQSQSFFWGFGGLDGFAHVSLLTDALLQPPISDTFAAELLCALCALQHRRAERWNLLRVRAGGAWSRGQLWKVVRYVAQEVGLGKGSVGMFVVLWCLVMRERCETKVSVCMYVYIHIYIQYII